MEPLLQRISSGQILVCDGAMGTFLQARGLQPGECPELWCIDRPDDVRAIHASYRDAGSDIVECNSFGGTSYKLKHYGLDGTVHEINRHAAELARDIADGRQHVLGSMGPTGEFMAPLGLATEEEFIAAFGAQAKALEEGGADAVIIETMTALEEAAAAVKAVKAQTRLVTVVSFTFDPQLNGGYATMMGVTPEAFARAAVEMGADVIGSNCGTGPDDMIKIVAALRAAAPDTPIIAMPNAGMPVIEDGQTVFKETPEEMAAKVPLLVEAGANIIGGCCGTSPAHIAAMKTAVQGL
ncbi:MAG: homocysteine S-methyltransferase family protein [Kiritimatiellia bacterium]|jgi:5-methyltetrahydrofolate--homocysteine methyltransferase|nr:homocysteine S-methyltransferase family protein [Kiritimatiellia bacterium]MDP6631593.1 homocysteine S-methyltransferase family protein [Kiritimatiellia bacterium]MDP6810192.1 homocysteine S-methyltransferase family protein [Kiritimatiellia bacterium]MDP7022902.1 homocysteine S-methyltransferase family protein [Kiritimatiellia bacterium]